MWCLCLPGTCGIFLKISFGSPFFTILYFSGRMHGLILASIVNVKVSPYEVSNKIRVFKNESRDMKIDEAVSIIKNSLKTISNDR